MTKKIIIMNIMFLLFITVNLNAKKKKIELTEKDMQVETNSSLQKIFEVSGNKEEIFDNLVDWIDNNFISEDSKNIKKDKGDGIITGIGDVVLSIKWGKDYYPVKFFFKYIIEIKDNKFRLTLKDIYKKQPAGESGIINMYAAAENDSLQQFSIELTKNGFLDRIKNGAEKKDMDW